MKLWKNILIWCLPVVLAVFSLSIGRFDVSFFTALDIVLAQVFPIEPYWTPMQESVILNLRLPRILLALLIGAGLSIAGASFQGMFGNPLVSADILGVAAGAGFGAALGILLFGHNFLANILALIFGLVAIGFAYMISGAGKNLPIFMLVLGGVITSALFQALVSLVKFLADPEEKLPAITYWLMGSLGTASYRDLLVSGPLIIVGMIVLISVRWRLNLLTLPEDEAKSLGISVAKLRWTIILSATLITAAAVSAAGIVGWIGLVIPHICRMLGGNNNRIVLPLCVAIGGSYLLLIDNLARSLTAAEIPLSILTAIIGAPFFAFLLRRTGGKWA
ncbi:FecCD family ABC transporter permease [Metasolibacillus meyeri]|uniref:FecCD family ABC transporter permease n=1 Tax=Metasolibacillus meyeri TaxID=1071052 RepID=UPI000D30504A|nr:iron ABC transporter permease [Metasolibacillus meyeri]